MRPITLFCEEHHYLSDLTGILGHRFEVRPCGEWSRFEQILDPSRCSVVEILRLAPSPSFLCFTAHRHLYPESPVVLVTSGDPSNAKELRRIVVNRVVWISEIRHALVPAVYQAGRETPVRELRRVLSTANLPGARLRPNWV